MYSRPAAMTSLLPLLVGLLGLSCAHAGNDVVVAKENGGIEDVVIVPNGNEERERLEHQREIEHMVDNAALHHDEKEQFERRFGAAACAFDAPLGAWYLIRAGLEVYAGSEGCPEDKKEECTMDVSGAISAFADTASYFAFVAETCPEIFNRKAACTAHITELLAGVSELISSIPGIMDECGANAHKLNREVKHGDIMERRLKSEKHTVERTEAEIRAASEIENVENTASEIHDVIEHHEDEGLGLEMAECVVDAGQATFLLGHAGLELTEATKACPERHEGLVCGTSISGMLGSFSMVAAYIAGAVTDCGQTINGKAACTSVISKLIGSLGEISAGAAGIAHSCVKSEHEEPRELLRMPAGHPGAEPRELLRMPHDLIARERHIFQQAVSKGSWNKADLENLIAAFPNKSLQLKPSAATRAQELRILLDRLQQSIPSKTVSTFHGMIAVPMAVILALSWPFSFV